MNNPLVFGSGFPLDRLRAFASCVSALHCALAPILLILAGLGVLVRQTVEWTFALLPVTLLTRGSDAGPTKTRAEDGLCFKSEPKFRLWFCSCRFSESLVRGGGESPVEFRRVLCLPEGTGR